ncbi:ATP-binding protein [Thermodesulfatator atlanticus]|uniref:ATP-binding protein n=1 Tax=Thermodesulfatator atlanticus TaxID=501497 RepID=UPI0003B43E4F|nr:ATP-binding protein [Thermodesulfatator atlanticus]
MSGGAEPGVNQINSFCSYLFQELPYPVLFCNSRGEIIFSSKQLEKLLGFRPAAINHLPGFPVSWSPEKSFCFETQINDNLYKVIYQPLGGEEGNIKGGIVSFQEKNPGNISIFLKEKRNALDILTKGLAHDFANFLFAVEGNLALAKQAKSLKEKDKYLKKASRALIRAKEFSEALLSGEPHRKYKACEVLHEILEMILNHSGIKWILNIPKDIWRLSIDQIQFTQIFLNLIKNAKEAMPFGGQLIIEAENIFISEEKEGLSPGPYVKFTLMDSGHGIPEKDLPLIFEPRYSSKGKARGFGLAVVKSIVENHNGKIEVESTPGAGTTFTIYLPAKPGKDCVIEEPIDLEQDFELCVYVEEPKKILIIDDDQDILEVLKEMLKTIGYVAEPKKDPEQALTLYEKTFLQGEPFRAVVVDYNLRGITGLEVLTRIKEINPAAKVIIITGLRNKEIEETLKRAGAKAVLFKPFSMKELLSALASPDKFS